MAIIQQPKNDQLTYWFWIYFLCNHMFLIQGICYLISDTDYEHMWKNVKKKYKC